VLTSSERIWDVNRAYQLGANSFLVKPMDFHDLVALTRVIREFWLTRSKAPDTSPTAVSSPPPPSASPPQFRI
jgi:DNA-binding NarL/FixJ family response regulator